MRKATRLPWERFVALDRAVRSGAYPNARTIGEELEVCRRTVLRDVEFMRDRLGAPIAFDRARNGYYYTEEGFRLPAVEMTEGELLALVLAERAFRQYRGAPFGPDLARAIRKLAEGMGDAVTIDLGDLAEGCSFRVTAPEEIDAGLFHALATAVRERRRLAMRYWTPSRDEETTREVDPYHLACVDGRWYLVAHCHARGEARMFAPARIRAVAATGATFDRPDGFRLDEYLAGAFGVFRGRAEESHRVRLRFTGEPARYLADRTWHPTQAAQRGDRGELDLCFELGSLREIERWALSWGPDCEVIEPRELRLRVVAAAEAIGRAYAGRDGSGDGPSC
ncbi:YafY family protein [Paludisphaera sp.]|uniref:helix-turn-helix transcriptional regulator n=1 Tax=Paludisphaera sp. TaxID=2017432 RepID=UPI00301D295A